MPAAIGIKNLREVNIRQGMPHTDKAVFEKPTGIRVKAASTKKRQEAIQLHLSLRLFASTRASVESNYVHGRYA